MERARFVARQSVDDPIPTGSQFQNVIDLTRAVGGLQADGYFVRREDLARSVPDATLEPVRRLYPLDGLSRSVRY